MATTKSKADSKQFDDFEQAREAASEAYDNFMKAQQHLKSAAVSAGVDLKDSAYEHIDETVEFLRNKKDTALKDSEDYIRNNPVSSAGIAFLGGFLISKLLSR